MDRTGLLDEICTFEPLDSLIGHGLIAASAQRLSTQEFIPRYLIADPGQAPVLFYLRRRAGGTIFAASPLPHWGLVVLSPPSRFGPGEAQRLDSRRAPEKVLPAWD